MIACASSSDLESRGRVATELLPFGGNSTQWKFFTLVRGSDQCIGFFGS